MCRIAGVIDFQLPVSKLENLVSEMCAMQKHGGPDDGDIFISADNHLVLGNRRLALVDLSEHGRMPMKYLDRYVITFNGEIYNYQILKEELIRLGHIFTNQTDTEVVLAAYHQWGTLSFSKLKGMFAFALWDEWNQELLLVRDPVGIKPLYYSLEKEALIFASETRPLGLFDSVKNGMATNWPVYLMAYGHLPEPISTMQSVHPLPKGCFIKYNISNRKISKQSYAHFSFSHKTAHSTDVYERVHQNIITSVKNTLSSDAPIGVFLSGGLDSSILTHIASDIKESQLNTVSLFFDETDYSEKKYQDLITRNLEGNVHQYLLKENDFHRAFPSVLNSMDLPSCDGINTWFICRYASSLGIKAVLSGIGGDELFGGYPSFRRMSSAVRLQQMPYFLKPIGKKTSSKKLNRLSYLQIDGVAGLYLFLRGHFSPNDIAVQMGAYEKEVWNILNEAPLYSPIDDLENKNKASWVEFNCYLQNQLLRDADVMSMAHGVEVRVPFLYNDLVELVFGTDPATKFYGKKPKQILIDIFKDVLPSQIWDRPKMGFSLPFSNWLGNSEYIRSLMLNSGKNNALNYQKFMEGNLHWSQLMSLIILHHFNKKAI